MKGLMQSNFENKELDDIVDSVYGTLSWNISAPVPIVPEFGPHDCSSWFAAHLPSIRNKKSSLDETISNPRNQEKVLRCVKVNQQEEMHNLAKITLIKVGNCLHLSAFKATFKRSSLPNRLTMLSPINPSSVMKCASVHANMSSIVRGTGGSQAQALNVNGRFDGITVVPVATAGPCTTPCRTIYPFLILLFFMAFIVAAPQMALLMIVLRSFSEEECSFALDHFAKFVLLKLMRKASVEGAIKYVEQDVFHIFGVPETIHSDNVALITSLRGAAAEIIQIIPEGKRTEFAAIMDALERKYGSKHVKEVSHLELSSLCQKLNERIQDYATEIERLANLAYIGVPDDVLERLKIDAFVKELRDVELKKGVWASRKTAFTERLGFALTQEAASVLWTSSMKWWCQQNIQRTGVKLKRVSTAGQLLTPKFSSPRVGITQSKRRNSTLKIDGAIQGCNYIVTLDTGASHSIINSTIVKEKFDPLGGVRFRTATGEEAAIKGKIMRNISISNVSMKHEFLVADIMDEVILGMDFMAKHGFVLDMKRQVLHYANVTLPLTVGYDRQAKVLQVVMQQQ
uniref:Retrotransposon gag domain-containing protein n=1 Tax=Glossina morsitans morsitans TaxID=37546 RepID=A0A1B0GB86_GLOMM